MIIECQSCHARFRLDAARIRGRGARVRCRRCGDSIIVLLEDQRQEAPSAAGPGDLLDLGSAVRGSFAEPPAGAPPGTEASARDNLIPFPAPAKSPEPTADAVAPAAPAAAAVPGEAPPAGLADSDGDEVDRAFERLLAEASRPASALEGDAAGAEPVGGGADAAPRDAFPPGQPAIPEAPPPETHRSDADAEAPPTPEEGIFLLTESDTLDFLKAGRQEDGPAEADADRSADISALLSSSPVDEAATSLRTPDVTGAPGNAPSAWAREAPAAAPAGAAASTGMTIEGNETPAPVLPDVPIAVPPLREESPAPAAPARAPSRGTAAPTRPASSPARAAAAGFAVLVLAGIGYFGFTPSGRRTIESVAPGAAALMGGRPSPPAGPAFDVRNVIGYYDTGAGARRILVIKGQVTNLSAKERSGIRVHATIQDRAEKTLAEQSVYAGNLIAVDALRKIDPQKARKVLDNRFGEGLANMNVGPGKSVPFMVVFFDAPEDIDSYRLEARDGE